MFYIQHHQFLTIFIFYTLFLSCRYAYSLFSGEGSAQVYTTKSDAEITLKFKSENFDIHPPYEVEASQCLTNIEIDRLDLQGGVVACK